MKIFILILIILIVNLKLCFPAEIRIQNNQLLVNNQPFTIKGVCYAPVPVGFDYNYNWSDHPEIYTNDFKLIKDMGANAIRIFCMEPLNTKMLDFAFKNGIYVIIGYWVDWEQDLSSPSIRRKLKNEFIDMIKKYKEHAAVLMWIFGCEVNWHSRWGSTSYWYSLLAEASEEAHEIDNRPITTSEVTAKNIGLLTLKSDDRSLEHLDLWAVNVWDINMGNAFNECSRKTQKPIWFEQTGIDAYHMLEQKEDEEMQAEFIKKQWERIAENLSEKDVKKNCTGVTFFEWCDEWWKSSSGESFILHDVVEDWRNPGFPDGSVQEEWFGIVAVNQQNYQRRPRKVYYILQEFWENKE